MAVMHCCVASHGCAVLCCAVLCCAVLHDMSLQSVWRHVGLSYARWSTEAISAREFSQYDYYMQPRIHTIMSQVSPLF